MVNDPKLIQEIINQLENVKIESLNKAIEEADKYFEEYFEEPIEVMANYTSQDTYAFDETLLYYNNVHKKENINIFNILFKKKQNKKEIVEAA